jgi:NhaA family Na+:H+ antiporter
VLEHHSDTAAGWGIPMATDVAFTLGAIALLGARLPRPLRVFVLALAVADDVASVVVLAVVASHHLAWGWLAGAALALLAVGLMRGLVRHQWWPYLVMGLVVWYCLARSGVEPTLGGAFVGMLIPMAKGAGAGRRLEGPVHALSSYVVLPLFVLANAGVVITGAVWHSTDATSVLTAIVGARILGKMLGISLAVALVVRLGVCSLPEHTSWRHLVGVSLLCGMGITVPLLFAHAVFGTDPLLYAGAQIGLLIGTLGAALLGAAVLLTVPSRATVPAADAALPTPPHDAKEA